MTVRAKFIVTSNTPANVTFVPARIGSAENADVFAAVPTGEINLASLNDTAREQFNVNEEFYVDFTSAGTDAGGPTIITGSDPDDNKPAPGEPTQEPDPKQPKTRKSRASGKTAAKKK